MASQRIKIGFGAFKLSLLNTFGYSKCKGPMWITHFYRFVVDFGLHFGGYFGEKNVKISVVFSMLFSSSFWDHFWVILG